MDIDREFCRIGRVEEDLPERGEVEVRVGEEEEGDLEGGVSGADMDGGCGVGGGTAEEGEVVEIVGEGGDRRGPGGGDNVWGEKEEEREGK